MISENVYLQYFCGLSGFQTKAPFHPTVFVDIRKRMGSVSFDKWNELIIERADEMKPPKKREIDKDKGTGSSEEQRNVESTKKDQELTEDKIEPKNKGTLKIDATVANQKIVYPTDAGLLNTARKESERMIDLLYELSNAKRKPRTYRRIARTEFLNFSKNRRKFKSKIRKFIRKQLGYLKRNIAHIENLLDSINDEPRSHRYPITRRDQKLYWVIKLLYKQQEYMYKERTYSVKDRIVNIYQPYVRPIPRGKDKVSTEFGAKVSAREVDGMSRVEHISWDNFNESIDLELQIKMFKKNFGHYPELLVADRIYLNRANRKYLKEKNIRIVGHPLGRPKKIKQTAYQKRKLKKERNQRNLIEGKFGQGKNAYGLSSIKAKRRDTSESWISSIFFIMNLITLMKIAEKYAIFCHYIKYKSTHLSKVTRLVPNQFQIQTLIYMFQKNENIIPHYRLLSRSCVR